MAEERAQRRLVAILAADVASYSQLMGENEEGTLRTLTAHLNEHIEPCIAEHRGRVVKTTGDGLLAEFVSVVDAVRCAVSFQNGMLDRNQNTPNPRQMRYRIGINLGDVIVQDDDVFGDGVNVAARLEGLAELGGICISSSVHQQVRGKLDCDFEDLGPRELKNIAEPVHVYRILTAPLTTDVDPIAQFESVISRPALAVLPFTNMGTDKEQEFFSDGLAEDIITLLSLRRSFPVIARNSSFAYKGASPDIRTVGQELGARYVIEGSVRRSGERVRVTAQLIDAESGHQLWADKFDRFMEDIFDIQDEITQRIVAIVEPEIELAELKRVAMRPTPKLNAWEHYLRGRSHLHLFTPAGNAEARTEFQRSIERDLDYSDAYAGLSSTYQRDILLEVAEDRELWLKLSFEAARRAVELDSASSFAHFSLSGAFVWSNQHESSIAETRLAVALNPSNVHACLALGNRLDIVGKPEDGIPLMEKSLSLNPLDPRAHVYLVQLARANINARHYEKALDWLREAIRRNPRFPHAHHVLAMCLGHMGRIEEAQAAAKECERLHPGFIKKRAEWNIYVDPAANKHLIDGLRKAGSLK
jgi:adenylate cyclase